MKYPVLPAGKAREVFQGLLDGSADAGAVEAAAEWSGAGVELETNAIEDLAAKLREEHATFTSSENAKDLDRFEGVVGARLHALLEELDVGADILDVPELWSYLTARYFWWFATWRQQSTFGDGDYAKYRKYVDGTNAAECVLLRAYLRARIVHSPERKDPYELATSIPHGADFWRSHVLRVQTATAPELTKAFASMQTEQRLPTSELRTYARRLNRTWTNVVLHAYDEDEAAALIDELRPAAPPEAS